MDNQSLPSNHKTAMQSFDCMVAPLSCEEKEELRLRILLEMKYKE